MTSSAERRQRLVVDDVELDPSLPEPVLRDATDEVDTVETGVAAIAAIGDKPYDLVLMDIDMPDPDCHQNVVAIRRQSAVRPAALSSHGEADVRKRSATAGMAAHGARPITPRALLDEIERVFCRQRPARLDCWQRQLYEEWASRLGAERMRGFLLKLRDQFSALGDLVLEGEHEALHRLAHDVASTSGTLGFLEVTRCCRALLEGENAGDCQARDMLQTAIEDAIDCLDHHFATARRGAA